MNVKVECRKIGGKLRVRPVGVGFWPGWNVQFPKHLRRAGRKFLVDGLEEAGGFYRVVGSIIPIINPKRNKMKTEKTVAEKPKKFKMQKPPTSLDREQLEVFVDMPKNGTVIAAVCTALAEQIQRLYPEKGYRHLTKDHLLEHLEQVEIADKKMGWGRYAAHKLRARFRFPESDKDFTDRLKQFEDEIAAYQAWRKEWAKEISAIESKKKAKNDDKRRKQEAALSRKMLQIQQQLGKLHKEAA